MKKIIKRQKNDMPRRTVRERICGLCPGGKRVYSAWERFVEKVVLTRSSATYRRATARCVVSVEILSVATQQCRNYLYDKS